MATASVQGRPVGVASRVAAVLWRRPLARLALLLTPPLAWFLFVYLASLAVLLQFYRKKLFFAATRQIEPEEEKEG